MNWFRFTPNKTALDATKLYLFADRIAGSTCGCLRPNYTCPGCRFRARGVDRACWAVDTDEILASVPKGVG